MEFFKNLKFAWNYAKDQKKNLIWFIIVNILIIAISVVVPILSAKIIVYLTDNEFHQLLLIAIIILLVEWFRNICNYFKRHNSNILFRETYVNLQTSLGKEILKIENIFVSKAPLIIQDIKEIQDLNCILNLENTKTTQCLKETLREYNVDIKSNMMSDATEVRVDAVKRNMGIAYVIKKSVKRELEAKELYEVELPIKLPSVKLNLIYLKGELSKVSKSFIKNYLRNKE